jgi:hypothetical protein
LLVTQDEPGNRTVELTNIEHSAKPIDRAAHQLNRESWAMLDLVLRVPFMGVDICQTTHLVDQVSTLPRLLNESVVIHQILLLETLDGTKISSLHLLTIHLRVISRSNRCSML